MAYYTTTALAQRHGLSVPATRYHLQQGGHKPRITRLTTPRTHTVHSWDEAAAAYLKERLTAHQQPGSTPNPCRWIRLAQGRAQAGISRAHLYRHIRAGTIRTQHRTQRTPSGLRKITYISTADLSRIIPAPTPRQTMHTRTISALRRSWLLLLAAEQQTGARHLAAYTEEAQHIYLADTASGTIHQLPITSPESSPTLTATYTSPPPADQWAAVTATFSAARATQHQHPGSILSFDTATVDIWSRREKTLLASYPLPH